MRELGSDGQTTSGLLRWWQWLFSVPLPLQLSVGESGCVLAARWVGAKFSGLSVVGATAGW